MAYKGGDTTMTDPHFSRNSLHFFSASNPKVFTACVTLMNPYEVGVKYLVLEVGTMESHICLLVLPGMLASSEF